MSAARFEWRDPMSRVIVSASLGLFGILLLARFADRAAQLGARSPAVLGVMLTACGISYAAALWISPARESVRWRHIAAGATAGWLAYVASGFAHRIGIAATSDGFRVLWAPCVEELTKAAMFASVWTLADERRGRREIVTTAVGVGAGFALRENFVYFGQALGQGGVYLEWIVLRAFPPVLAHAAFAMIAGGAVATRVVHARVLGQPVPRFSVFGLVVAVLAHVAFNFVALVITKATGSWAVEVSAAWSVVAIGAAWLLRQRVITLAREDEPVVTSMVPALARPGRIAVGVVVGVAALWLVPSPAVRYVAIATTPMAFGLAIALAAGRALGETRVLVPLLVGIFMRPIVHTPELMLGALAAAIRTHRALRVPVGLLANVVWIAPIALVTHAWTRHRSSAHAIVYGLAITGGLAGASVGGVLVLMPAAAPHPVRAMMEASVPTVPVALVFGAIAAWIACSSRGRLAIACVAVPALATAMAEIERHLRPTLTRAVITSVLALAVIAACVAWLWQRERTRDTRVMAPNEHAEPTQAA
jgi:hypothetical protein